MNTTTLAAGVIGFLLGGLTVSIAAELEDEPEPDAAAVPRGAAPVAASVRGSGPADHRPDRVDRVPVVEVHPGHDACRRAASRP